MHYMHIHVPPSTGNATCSCPEEDCEDSDNALPIAIAAVGSSVGGGLLGALLCAVIACCIIKCKGKSISIDIVEACLVHITVD